MSNLWITPEELGDYAETEFAYEAAKSASNLLWALSGRKYSGTTTVTERYVCSTLAYRFGPSARNNRAELVLGDVYNMPYSDMDSYTAVTSDGLSPQSRLRLRGRPVTKIHTIRNRAGVVIEPTSYYLVDHSTIQAVAGARWAPCDSEVTYTYGVEPPTLGRMAARTLAIELVKRWNDMDDCLLPQRVTSVARQGVSYTILDSQEFIDDLRTGLYEVDMFLKSVNPDRARAKARVFTPDYPRARRYTPRSLRLAVSDLDIAATAASTGSTTVPLFTINAEFLFEELGWIPYVVLRNYTETTSRTIENCTEIIDPTPDPVDIVTKELEDNVAILTTDGDHNLEVGAEIVIAGVDATFNGSYTVLNVLDNDTFTYAKTAADVASTAASGTVTASADQQITITLDYNDVLSIIGKVDPGTYDLYAERDNGSEIETVYIASANLTTSLYSQTVSAYTLG
jgi:hypothetical protein